MANGYSLEIMLSDDDKDRTLLLCVIVFVYIGNENFVVCLIVA